MERVYPDYYKRFKCIGSKCLHNCCIGWEIDIDEKTYEYYKGVAGDFGKHLKNNISEDNIPHFILDKNERCPLLNKDNLCDIIINSGEEHLCTICAEHPRFHNSLPNRVESGLGLCCEECARIIIGKKEETRLITENKDKNYFDEIIDLRDKIISTLQHREYDIKVRLSNAFEIIGSTSHLPTPLEYSTLLFSLERLNDEWTELLNLFGENYKENTVSDFKGHMKERQTEYEQFLVYLIYRHFANCVNLEECTAVLKFAATSYMFMEALGEILYTLNGKFTFEDQIELVRLFSSEIEYSDENLPTVYKYFM